MITWWYIGYLWQRPLMGVGAWVPNGHWAEFASGYRAWREQ